MLAHSELAVIGGGDLYGGRGEGSTRDDGILGLLDLGGGDAFHGLSDIMPQFLPIIGHVGVAFRPQLLFHQASTSLASFLEIGVLMAMGGDDRRWRGLVIDWGSVDESGD